MSLRGGKRQNAGRPVGQGQYAEPTKVIRVPESKVTAIKEYLASFQNKPIKSILTDVDEIYIPSISNEPVNIPLFSTKVAAGFPSPADDYVEKSLDVSEFLIDYPTSTFFVTIKGDSMIDIGLMPEDKAVVDRSKTAKRGDIVLAVVDREFTIKILDYGANKMPRLMPANSSGAYRPIYIRPDMHFEIFGVVIGSFRRFK